ncbi:MAG: nitrous oxide reductase accessory protein NosL [Thermodesulfobacteriota bacterium]
MRISLAHLLRTLLMVLILVGASWGSLAHAGEDVTLPSGHKFPLGGVCPVCGMKVGGELESMAIYGYKLGRLESFAGVAATVFQDHRVVGFDGARCLFIYNTIPKRFGIDVGKIAHRFVIDFETRQFLDVNQAYLVLGTPIRGFMGYDLIPFSTKEKAEAFKTEYSGKRVLQLQTATPEQVDRK